MRLEEILCHAQSRLKDRLNRDLHKMSFRTVNRKGFLYASGSVPVLLVAHLDTVHSQSVKTICRSDDGDILMSPQGIGGDDRAGVYMIMEILKTHKCHVLFCEDEERGAVGARKFSISGISPDVNYIVEFDRKGMADAVFYECGNKDFTEFVCGFGFEESDGSFSDISVIAPALGIAAVNLSTGYCNAHTTGESINLSIVRANIKKVRKMLDAPARFFEYMEKPLPLIYRGKDLYDYPMLRNFHRGYFDYDFRSEPYGGEQNYRQNPKTACPGREQPQRERGAGGDPEST